MHTACTLSHYNALVIKVIARLKNLLQDKGNIMKKLILTSILALGLVAGFAYANEAALELEHQLKLQTGDDSFAGDMSAMKAAGKCSADQVGKKKIPKKKAAQKPKNKAEIELEHQSKLKTGDDSVGGDMGNMKRCGSS